MSAITTYFLQPFLQNILEDESYHMPSDQIIFYKNIYTNYSNEFQDIV